MSIGFLFPGQGTQRVGMGHWLERASKAAAAVFDTGSAVLGRDLRALCFRGPERELTLTQNTQVAVFTVNAVAAAALGERGSVPDAVAGHSVGELNALCAAGVLPLEEGFRLVAARGALMGRVRTPGAMAAVIGLDLDRVAEICADVPGPVVPALLNGPSNVVISGAAESVATASDRATAAGARKVTRLVVSSAFHSPLMAEATDEWRAVVAAAGLRPPSVPLFLNVPGASVSSVDAIQRAVVEQLTAPVRWTDVVSGIAALGVRRLVEAGDSKVLTVLARAIVPGVPCVSLSDPRAFRRLTTLAPT
ncbi:ACP S-malonyltransferase [Cryptosporangium aurantiacum]|uniref:Malonyl CoA-acyl carrier protein transacylase n=1 Tax=Cryptosporangium aurantiacum TaxID=134849 RepID=A0A1M7QAS6_9ACTN|nr:ACP S-malonyltransferase [Cryptosporangium aurantiacum]SHN27639.1 [Acyl-carrier-protein] S-malonyltransferase [Cryptosporangium aurantiacum]